MSPSRRVHFDEVLRAKLESGEDPVSGRGNLRVMKALALLSPGDRLLDLGCGTGVLGEAAATRFREVHGVDISPDAVRLARQRGVQARVLEAGSEPLPYPDAAFDAVTALSMLQYVVDVDSLLRECRRVLRPGAQFIACVPNMRAAWRLWRLAVEGTFPRTSLDAQGVDGGTVHYFTTRSAGDLVARAGLHVVRAYGLFCLPRWLEHHADGGAPAWLKREFLSAEVLVDARANPLESP
jgi:SAM-dependent methyltransferase